MIKVFCSIESHRTAHGGIDADAALGFDHFLIVVSSDESEQHTLDVPITSVGIFRQLFEAFAFVEFVHDM